MIFEVIKYIKKKIEKIHKNQKKSILKKVKKNWPNTKKEQKFKVVSETVFSALSRMYSFRLYNQFFWENSTT